VRSGVFARAGLLDEDFFFSFEDLEFCLRARRHGFDVGIVDAVAYHEGGRSLGPGAPARFYYAARNHLMAADRGAPVAGRLARAGRWAAIAAFNAAHALLARDGRLFPRLVDYFRGRTGQAPERLNAWRG
jgi:GT2 family glycosyltransferase